MSLLLSADYTIEISFHFYAAAYHGWARNHSGIVEASALYQDIAVKHSPSYCVGLVDYPEAEPFVMTLYWVKLSDVQQHWWYMRRVKSAATTIQEAPHY